MLELGTLPMWRHFLSSTPLSDNADFQCLRSQSYITEDSITNYFVAKSKENSEGQSKLELDIAEKKSHCEALKDLIDSNLVAMSANY